MSIPPEVFIETQAFDMSGGTGIVDTTLIRTDFTETAGIGQKLSCMRIAKVYWFVGLPHWVP